MARLRIGDLAARAGVPTSTVRYYERAGLVRPAARTEGGYRLYTEQAADEIRFIRRAQALGFSVPEVAEILKLTRTGEATCAKVIAIARKNLDAVERELEDLAEFRRELQRVIRAWETTPGGASCSGLCRLIETADPPIVTRRNRRVKRGDVLS